MRTVNIKLYTDKHRVEVLNFRYQSDVEGYILSSYCYDA